jgi:Domain of unknown function (DUF2017).
MTDGSEDRDADDRDVENHAHDVGDHDVDDRDDALDTDGLDVADLDVDGLDDVLDDDEADDDEADRPRRVVGLFQADGQECVARFTPQDVQVLRQSMASLAALLTGDADRDDPVVERLFPDVYPTDPVQQAEFRRLTEADLRAGKLKQARGVLADLLEAGGEVRLTPERAELWLRALTDVRLALGTRLGVTDDTDIEAEIDAAVGRDPGSSRVMQLTVYLYLTYLQESLVGALMDREDVRSPEQPEDPREL